MSSNGVVTEREITSPVALVGSDGKLNPNAVGWARNAIVDTSGVDGHFGVAGFLGRGWGRNKRWEYWNVITPTHIIAMTISSLDYASVSEIWVLDRKNGREMGRAVTLPSGSVLTKNLWKGTATAKGKGLSLSVKMGGNWARLRGKLSSGDNEEIAFDVKVDRPKGHEALAVVVPWNSNRFQYTVKDIALPARGWLRIGGQQHKVPEGSWAVLDHGRGRWPYNVVWNWGAGSGVSNSHTVGIQVGGKWTDGTGVTENGMIVDGRLYKISEYLKWDYDVDDETRAWKVSGGGLEASLQPFHLKRSATNLFVLSSKTTQAFGYWSGKFVHKDLPGGQIEFEDIVGWAEDVHNRW